MMFCHKCGNQLPEGAMFCPKCGTKVISEDTVRKSSDTFTENKATIGDNNSDKYSGAINNQTVQNANSKKSDKRFYDDNIKPYYRKQFERISSGKKPNFNWAAFFLNSWIQLYYGCTKIFCKTFFPLLIMSVLVSLISIVGALTFNLVLVGVTSVLGVVISVCSVVLSIINGFKFNKWYYQDVINNPGKKRSRKGFWILLISEIIMAFVMALLPYILKPIYDNFSKEKSNNEIVDTQLEYENVNLSETYINEVEGISFRYPSAWVPIGEEELGDYIDGDEFEYPLAFLANEIEDMPEENTYIMISKFVATQADIDHLFIDDKQFVATFDDEVSVRETSITEVDGLPARKITYVDSERIGYQSYFYAVGSSIYRIDFVWRGESSGSNQRFFDAIMNSYTVTVKEGPKDTYSSEAFIDENSNGLMDYKMAYAQKVRELAADDTMQFSLIYLTGNKIPELVAEHHGYDVSVFAWTDGEIVTLMDQWAYGAGGNTGYEYLPGNNIIRNYNMDYAGAVIYELYFTVNDSHEVIELLDEELSIWYFRDINEDGEIDEDEYCDDPVFYYGDSEISEEEYDSYQMKGDFETIRGELSSEEILAQLDEDKSNEYNNSGDIESNLSDGFMWIEEPTGRTDEVMTEITGVIQNTSDYAYDYASISFNLYDSFENQIGTAMASITDFKSGGHGGLRRSEKVMHQGLNFLLLIIIKLDLSLLGML